MAKEVGVWWVVNQLELVAISIPGMDVENLGNGPALATEAR